MDCFDNFDKTFIFIFVEIKNDRLREGDDKQI